MPTAVQTHAFHVGLNTAHTLLRFDAFIVDTKLSIFLTIRQNRNCWSYVSECQGCWVPPHRLTGKDRTFTGSATIMISLSLSLYIYPPAPSGAIRLRGVCCKLPVPSPSNHLNHKLTVKLSIHFSNFQSSSLQLSICQSGISFSAIWGLQICLL